MQNVLHVKDIKKVHLYLALLSRYVVGSHMCLEQTDISVNSSAQTDSMDIEIEWKANLKVLITIL